MIFFTLMVLNLNPDRETSHGGKKNCKRVAKLDINIRHNCAFQKKFFVNNVCASEL